MLAKSIHRFALAALVSAILAGCSGQDGVSAKPDAQQLATTPAAQNALGPQANNTATYSSLGFTPASGIWELEWISPDALKWAPATRSVTLKFRDDGEIEAISQDLHLQAGYANWTRGLAEFYCKPGTSNGSGAAYVDVYQLAITATDSMSGTVTYGYNNASGSAVIARFKSAL